MFRHNLESKFYYKTFFHSFLLSFLAGNVNAGGFMACGRFVTHVTGFATIFAIDVAHHSWSMALGILSVPFYFLLGTMLSAYLVDRRIHQGKQAGYVLVMGLMTLCFVSVVIGGSQEWFGYFGEGVNLQQDYFLLALLCGASGLQNAAITTSTGSVIRTTHLTGITTDLGIGLMKLIYPSTQSPEQRTREIRINFLRGITIMAFILGGCVGAVLYLKYQYKAFLLPAVISFYAMMASTTGRLRGEEVS